MPQISLPQPELTAFCRRNRIRRLALFGSVLTDEFGENSDVDVLVEFEPDARVGMLAFEGMEIELSRLLGRKVDLNTPGWLSPRFREDVQSGSQTVYAAP